MTTGNRNLSLFIFCSACAVAVGLNSPMVTASNTPRDSSSKATNGKISPETKQGEPGNGASWNLGLNGLNGEYGAVAGGRYSFGHEGADNTGPSAIFNPYPALTSAFLDMDGFYPVWDAAALSAFKNGKYDKSAGMNEGVVAGTSSGNPDRSSDIAGMFGGSGAGTQPAANVGAYTGNLTGSSGGGGGGTGVTGGAGGTGGTGDAGQGGSAHVPDAGGTLILLSFGLAAVGMSRLKFLG